MINDLQRVPGSFRDPAGHVFECGNKIFRTVNACFSANFDRVHASGILEQFTRRHWVLPANLVNPDRDFLQNTSP